MRSASLVLPPDQSFKDAAREALIESLVIYPEGPAAGELEPIPPTEGS